MDIMVHHKSSQYPASSPKMDPGIWNRLPEEILDSILTFLPLKTFLSLRTTCKHFNSLIFSPPFIKHFSSSSSSSSPSSLSSPFSSFILLSHPQFHHHQYLLYNTTLNNWSTFSLSLSPMLSYSPSAQLLSTSNGLLCFSLPNLSSFLISNLLTKSSKIVKFPKHPFSFELLTLVSTSIGFKLFMISTCGSSDHTTFVYDSRIELWKRFDLFYPVLTENYHQQGEYNNGYLFFTTPEPFSVVRCDMENGMWERLTIELPGETMFVRLVSSGEGKLYLFGGIGSNGISRRLKLWELRENWVEIDSVPELICRKFMSVCYHNYEHVYCFWHQGMICVCCYSWSEILYYNVLRRTWHWLPKCPSLPEKCSCGFRWFSFVPELYAFV